MTSTTTEQQQLTADDRSFAALLVVTQARRAEIARNIARRKEELSDERVVVKNLVVSKALSKVTGLEQHLEQQLKISKRRDAELVYDAFSHKQAPRGVLYGSHK